MSKEQYSKQISNYERIARANGWSTEDFGTISRAAKPNDNLEGPGEYLAKMVFVESWQEACEHDGLTAESHIP